MDLSRCIPRDTRNNIFELRHKSQESNYADRGGGPPTLPECGCRAFAVEASWNVIAIYDLIQRLLHDFNQPSRCAFSFLFARAAFVTIATVWLRLDSDILAEG